MPSRSGLRSLALGLSVLFSSVLVLSTVSGSGAAAQSIPQVSRLVDDLELLTRQLTNAPLGAAAMRGPRYVEERLTDGELFFRLQDYPRASIIFTDIVDNHAEHRAAPDALFMLGESLFMAGDYLGARSRLRELMSRAGRVEYRSYLARTLGRLIEIAIHIRDFSGVEDYFQQLSKLPPTEVESATMYFRGKYVYNRSVPAEEDIAGGAIGAVRVDAAGLEEARRYFEAVSDASPYYAQARYFVGVILTQTQRFAESIEAFRRVLRAPATDAEQLRVVELANLALGRLYYETDQLDRAVEAYQKVSRNSQMFDTVLYELAWVYIRMGDSGRAERALELLGVAAPESPYIADGRILRGNLLLRLGRLSTAREVFKGASSDYRPIREQLDEVVARHGDPRSYFEGLVRQNMEAFDARSLMPESAYRLAPQGSSMERALEVLSSLSGTRSLMGETGAVVAQLRTALLSPNRINVFLDLREQRRRTESLRNQAADLRRKLVAIEDGLSDSVTPELKGLRKRRREVESKLTGLPTKDSDFTARNAEVLSGIRDLRRALSELSVQLLGMDARIVATERFTREGGVKDADEMSGREAVVSELQVQRGAVQGYRRELGELRQAIEAARVEVGIGDFRYERDKGLRQEYAALVAKERALGAVGSKPGMQLDRLFTRIAGVESRLDGRDARIEGIVEQRVQKLTQVLEREIVNMDSYREEMAVLEQDAEQVVGGLSYTSFTDVRQRFYELVLKADVGTIDVAWADREEHRRRVEMLTRERARSLRALDDEFREIIESPASGGGQ